MSAWLLILIGWVFVAASFPVDGVPGIGLALVGIAFFVTAAVKSRRTGGPR